MREFTIRSGNYAGKHKIYENIEEAKQHGINEVQNPWYNKSVQIGDWCVADDGYIVQCLNRYILKNKRHINGQYTDVYRFPMGTVYVYYDSKGETHIKNLYAHTTTSQKGSLATNGSNLGKYMTAKKQLFVSLVSQGVSPYTAYVQSYRGGYPSNVYKQTNKLLMDQTVRTALVKEMKPMIQKIEDEVKAKTGLSLSDFLAEQIISVITDKKASNRDRRENIKLALALFGEQLGLKPPAKSNRKIEDATYEEVAPPSLGPIN